VRNFAFREKSATQDCAQTKNRRFGVQERYCRRRSKMEMHLFHRFKAFVTGLGVAAIPYSRFIPDVVSGEGSTSEVGARAAKLGMSKVLIVTDSILAKLGVINSTLESLKSHGLEYVVYDGVLPDPTTEQVLAGAKIYKESGCDGIIAVGGGSSMDCAKVIGAYVLDPKPVEDFGHAFSVHRGIPPFICIPTTHGAFCWTSFFLGRF